MRVARWSQLGVFRMDGRRSDAQSVLGSNTPNLAAIATQYRQCARKPVCVSRAKREGARRYTADALSQTPHIPQLAAMATARVGQTTHCAHTTAAHPRPRRSAHPARRHAHRVPARATDAQTEVISSEAAAANDATPSPAAPQEGGEREVRVTLETSHFAGGLVRLKEGRTPRNTRLVVVRNRRGREREPGNGAAR